MVNCYKSGMIYTSNVNNVGSIDYESNRVLHFVMQLCYGDYMIDYYVNIFSDL